MPLFTSILAPYISCSSSYNNAYLDKVSSKSIILQAIYILPIFILILLIVCDTSCYRYTISRHIKYDSASSEDAEFALISCQLLLIILLIHIIFYMDLLQYFSFKKLTNKITIFYQDHFIPISIYLEFLLILILICHSFYLNDHNHPFNMTPTIVYICSIPLIFPFIYYKYYYLQLDANKLSILYHLNHKLNKHSESMVERVYCFIHIICHEINSYDMNYVLINHDDNINHDDITPDKTAIIKHDINKDIALCLQYQNFFMKLNFYKKIGYICQIAPYDSKFFKSKRFCPKCDDKNLYLIYLALVLKLLGNIMPIWWFSYVYLYKLQSHRISKESWQWFKKEHNKYEHTVLTVLILLYLIICILWILCAFKIFSKEYYYGFIRSLLINVNGDNDNKFVSNKVENFHHCMIRNHEIITVLEKQGLITHVAIQIVSYLPQISDIHSH